MSVPCRAFVADDTVLRRLRAALRSDLEGVGLPDDAVDDAVLCVHEACMNSIQHGQGELLVSWDLRWDEVDFEVCDDGTGPELSGGDVEPDTERVSGRGLFLIRRLARRLETKVRGSKRCIAFSVAWAEHLESAGFGSEN
jgi:anti-sigma regulatory factor (Ser/Thr protein kinase)